MARPRKERDLPLYSNQVACSEDTGIPLATLRQAKAAGCPAFQSNRVELRPLLKWLFDPMRREGEVEETKEQAYRRKAVADANMAEIEEAKMRGDLILTQDVERWASGVFIALKQGILASGLINEEKDELLAHLQRLTIEAGNPKSNQDLDYTAEIQR